MNTARLVSLDDMNVDENDLNLYLLVLKVAGRYGVELSTSLESEMFFRKLLEGYQYSAMLTC